ncbi:MAG: NADH ubiquinone oxidoreductase chain A, partial [uncultured Thermomicrobiales bacterium]
GNGRRELGGRRPDDGGRLQHGDDPADPQLGRCPVQAVPGQGRPVRERRAGRGRGQAPLHAALLRRGDAVRDLRHRGHLHLPLGRDLRRPRPLRVHRDGLVHRPALRRLRLRLEERGPRMGL